MSVAPLAPLAPPSAPCSRLEALRPLRMAVIGAGVMGKRHARVLASSPERFELVAVMDVDAVAASELARSHGAEPVSRDGEAIARAEAVVIATPIGAHAPSVRRALANGRHVLVEKPIAGSARDARELVVLAESSGAHLFVGHSERFNPVVRALARLVEPASVEAIAFHRVGSGRAVPGGGEGALVNLGVHDFDLASYLVGSPLSPIATTSEPGAGAVEERAEVAARTESGAKVRVVVDQRPADGVRRRAILVATPTHLWEGNLLAPLLVRICRATGVREAIPLDTEEPLAAQAFAFLDAVRGKGGNSNEIATGRDGMHALLVAERARRQVGLRGENLAFPPAFDTR